MEGTEATVEGIRSAVRTCVIDERWLDKRPAARLLNTEDAEGHRSGLSIRRERLTARDILHDLDTRSRRVIELKARS
jgi:hypothetical protein